MDMLEFENKRFIRVLKIEKQKKNRSKKLNLLDEDDNDSQLFSLLWVRDARDFAVQKKVDKE